MSEEYRGRKFTTVFLAHFAPRETKKTLELIRWCHLFAELGLAPEHPRGSVGNLSFRTRRGFVITGGGVSLRRMEPSQLVEVIRCDVTKREVYARGILEPSGETILHWAMYEKRPDVRAIFHGHDELVLAGAERLGLPVTAREQAYGTVELAEEATKILNNRNYMVMKNHGFLALGRSLSQAGKLAEKIHKTARSPGQA